MSVLKTRPREGEWLAQDHTVCKSGSIRGSSAAFSHSHTGLYPYLHHGSVPQNQPSETLPQNNFEYMSGLHVRYLPHSPNRSLLPSFTSVCQTNKSGSTIVVLHGNAAAVEGGASNRQETEGGAGAAEKLAPSLREQQQHRRRVPPAGGLFCGRALHLHRQKTWRHRFRTQQLLGKRQSPAEGRSPFKTGSQLPDDREVWKEEPVTGEKKLNLTLELTGSSTFHPSSPRSTQGTEKRTVCLLKCRFP